MNLTVRGHFSALVYDMHYDAMFLSAGERMPELWASTRADRARTAACLPQACYDLELSTNAGEADLVENYHKNKLADWSSSEQ